MSASSYHHGNLRQALIDEAVTVLREAGPDAITIRDLARRVGVSHSAAYSHFSSRDDLIDAVAAHAYATLVASMQRRLDSVEATDPVVRARRRLAEVGRAYVEFALTEPGLFKAAFTAPSREKAPVSSQGPYVLLGEILDELVAAGFLSPAARTGAELTCWSAVHGFSVLSTDGPLATVELAARADAFDKILGDIDRSYAASTGTQVDARDILRTT